MTLNTLLITGSPKVDLNWSAMQSQRLSSGADVQNCVTFRGLSRFFIYSCAEKNILMNRRFHEEGSKYGTRIRHSQEETLSDNTRPHHYHASTYITLSLKLAKTGHCSLCFCFYFLIDVLNLTFLQSGKPVAGNSRVFTSKLYSTVWLVPFAN